VAAVGVGGGAGRVVKGEGVHWTLTRGRAWHRVGAS